MGREFKFDLEWSKVWGYSMDIPGPGERPVADSSELGSESSCKEKDRKLFSS
jgi:hypothetical protein